ncbi:MAG: hypothetical protein EOO05_16595 [Chitinophagaceae bacterium]|nr:MAG: hypothetical protein EOO05_16595 [Chitinophagaceae bacterium]
MDQGLLDFTRDLLAFRKQHPAFSRKRWFRGQPIRGVGVEDIAWIRPDGTQMEDADWSAEPLSSFAVFLNGLGLRCLNEHGEKMTDDNFLVIFNISDQPAAFTLPDQGMGEKWETVFDTCEAITRRADQVNACDTIHLEGRQVLVLLSPNPARGKMPPESLPDVTDQG